MSDTNTIRAILDEFGLEVCVIGKVKIVTEADMKISALVLALASERELADTLQDQLAELVEEKSTHDD